MTVRINFLPKGSQNAGGLGPKEWAVVAAVSVAVVGSGVFYANTYAATNRLERQLVADQAALAAMQSELKTAQEIKAREAAVEQAEAELRSLHGRDWSDVLSTLRSLTPQHVTWTRLEADGDAMTLKATSSGLFDVAQLFAGLVEHPLVAEVALRYVDQTGVPITAIVRETVETTEQATAPAAGGAQANLDGDETDEAAEQQAEQAGQVTVITVTEVPRVIGMLRQMEFEMVIHLVPVKGGDMYGA